MAKVEIFEPRHVNDLALRTEDAAEIIGMALPINKALWRSWQRSIYRRAMYVDGMLACAWGVGGQLLGGTNGYTWFLTSKEVEKIPVTLAKQGRREVIEMLKLFPRLTGFVAEDYTKAIRFLRLLGFQIGKEPAIVPATGARLLNYWMER